MSEDKRKSTDYAAMERPIFEAWKDAGYFQRTPGFGEHAGESYTIVIPPPNITGVLHMGHALNDTIQDAACAVSKPAGSSAPTTPASPPRPRWTSAWPSRASPVWKSAARRSSRNATSGARSTAPPS